MHCMVTLNFTPLHVGLGVDPGFLLQERLDPHFKAIGPITFLGCKRIINNSYVNIMGEGKGQRVWSPISSVFTTVYATVNLCHGEGS